MSAKHKRKSKIIKRMRTHIRYISSTILSMRNIIIGVTAIVAVSFILTGMNKEQPIHTADLLTTIAKVESNDNYNAYFGNAANTDINFTAMPVKDVLKWQADFVASGSASSAVGRYQFIDSTLRGLVSESNINPDTIFDKQLQDQLAEKLLERRGLRQYVSGQITQQEFAHNLSKEWAALPIAIGQNPGESYYAGDGLNTARLSVEQIYSSIATVRKLE